MKEGKTININGKVWNINQRLNFKSYNVVYALRCKKEKCGKTYIGETKRYLKSRLDDHRGYIVNTLTSTATGEHFTQPGHSLADLQVTALERVKKNNTLYRKEREEYFIRKFILVVINYFKYTINIPVDIFCLGNFFCTYTPW